MSRAPDTLMFVHDAKGQCLQVVLNEESNTKASAYATSANSTDDGGVRADRKPRPVRAV